MVDPTTFKSFFEKANPYDQYVATGSADQQASWKAFHGRVKLNAEQQSLLGGFTRKLNVLVISGTWCGDCVQQVPMLDAIAKATANAGAGAINLRIIDRDAGKALSDQVKVCGGNRVPTVLFANEDFEFCGLSTDKSISRLRGLAARSLGAACPLPGAPIESDEVAATLQDWVNDFEKMHLLVRLSAKLRDRHGD